MLHLIQPSCAPLLSNALRGLSLIPARPGNKIAHDCRGLHSSHLPRQRARERKASHDRDAPPLGGPTLSWSEYSRLRHVVIPAASCCNTGRTANVRASQARGKGDYHRRVRQRNGCESYGCDAVDMSASLPLRCFPPRKLPLHRL